MSRIVSLIASSTEIVCALGFEEGLVGRSHECDFPESVRSLPACTSPKFPVEGSSREIDSRVKSILRDALSVYSVDADLLKRLRPDVILTQSQCEVCAVSEKDVERAVCDWTGGRPKVVSLKPDALADIFADINRVASALGAPERGEELVAGLAGRMEAVARRAAALPARPRVACIEWIDPLMAAGNWMPELVSMAGGHNLFGEPGRHSPWMSIDELEKADPDAIVVLPCGFDMDRAASEMPALTGRPGWAGLKAVREGRVFLADGNQYFNRPGPRIADSLEIIAELLHPEAFAFGYEGRGWRRFA